MFRLTLLLGKLILSLLRLSGRGGSALPGLVIEKVSPDFLTKFRNKMRLSSILITGTNGKTTTTKIISHFYSENGYKVLTNKSGSNFNRGIISTIIDHSSWSGRLDFDIAIFEVDEAYSPTIAKSLRPQTLVVLNVFRDQLDRFGELDSTVARMAKAASYAQTLVVNGDDQSLLALRGQAKKDITFGSDKTLRKLLPNDMHLDYSNTTRKTDEVASQFTLIAAHQHGDCQELVINANNQTKIELNTQLMGLHNAVNLTAAVATALSTKNKIDNKIIRKVASQLLPAFGRGETIVINDQQKIFLMLVKNPSGFNQTLASLETFEGIDCVIVAINDQIADGRDISWLWDANLDKLSGLKGQKSMICTGSRAYDMAVRLKYSNFESEVVSSVKSAVNKAAKDGHSSIVIIATYTAMLEIRKHIATMAKISEFWK